MGDENYIVPYTYHSMAMSIYTKLLSETLKERLGDMWPFAVLLPKYFDPSDVKATPRFHKGEHVACYCLSNLWPGVSDEATKDDAMKLSTILLFTRGELRGFIVLKPKETLCLPVGARMKHVEAPCWSCPNFKERECLKKSPLKPRMALLLRFDSVFVLPGKPEFKDLKELIGDALRQIRKTAGVRNIRALRWEHIRREDVQNVMKELYDDIKQHVTRVSCEKWRGILKEIAKVLCEEMPNEVNRMCQDNRTRSIWAFADILQVVKEVCPEACSENSS